MEMLRTLRAEWLITKRTGYRWLAGGAPLLAALALLGYSYGRPAAANQDFAMYSAFYQMVTAVLPLWIALLAGVMALQEEQAGHLGGLLGRKQSRWMTFSGKLMMILIPVIVGNALSTVVLIVGMHTVLGIEDINLTLFAVGAGLSALGTLTLCVVHLWLGIGFGLGATVTVGGAGLLVSALIGGTVLGDDIWCYVPWAWPLRLAWYPLYLQLNETAGLETGVLDSYTGQFLIAAGLATGSIVLVFLLSGRWFSRWEGRKINE